jgi:methyl-accepting chemotaxis protein
MKIPTGLHRRFAALRIGVKLGLAFFLVLALTAGLGAFSLLKLAAVNQASSDLALKWMPSVGFTTSVRRTILEFREFELKHTRAADVGYMTEYEEKMQALLSVATANIGGYAQLHSDDQGKELFAVFQKAWAQYLAMNKKVIALGREIKPGDAMEIAEGGGKSALDDAIVALDQLTDMSFASGKAAAEGANVVYASSRLWTTGFLLGAVLIGLALALIISRGLIRQLGGEPSYAVRVTDSIAAGDLTPEIRLPRNDQSSLLHAIKVMRDSVAGIVAQVRDGSEAVSAASAQIASSNHDLSARTEQQASALEETAASMKHLSSTVLQNTDNARKANELAQSASSVAIQGGEVVAQVVGTMKGINESSMKIADIISVIDGIAFQTNILALNAAVEAARAGEQGRGFAVVASEVRSLAGRSAQAAKEIKSLINASVARVAQGTQLVDQAGSTMTEVVHSIGRVTAIMGEISAASIEQNHGVDQVGAAIKHMDQATQQNATLVKEMAAAAAGLKSQAQELVETVSVFRLIPAHGSAHLPRLV